MSKLHKTVLVFAGALGGSLVTSLFFVLLGQQYKDTTTSGKEDAVSLNSELSETSKIYDRVTPRDIPPGNCVLSGTVMRSDESPIEGAIVGIRLLNVPFPESETTSRVTTGKDGTFSFEGLSDDASYQLWAWSNGGAVSNYENAKCGARTDMIIESGASMTLEFKVNGEDLKEPKEVTIAGSSLWPPRRILTGEESTLTIEGLTPGYVVLKVLSKNLVYESKEPTELVENSDTKLTVELLDSGDAKVRVGSDNKPVEGAFVLIGSESTSMLNRAYLTDANGESEIDTLYDTQYSVSVFARGFAPSKPRAIRAGDTIAVNLVPGAVANGTVVDENGNPVSGASIYVDYSSEDSPVFSKRSESRSFSESFFEAALLGWPVVSVITGDGSVLVGPGNMPLPERENETPAHTAQGSAISDDNGGFQIDGLPSGQVEITATHPSLVIKNPLNLLLEPGEKKSELVLRMRKGVAATVRTLDSSGNPVPDAEVSAWNADDERVVSAATDADGRVVLMALPDEFHIEAKAEGKIPAVTKQFRSRSREVEFVLTLPIADKTLHGRVVDERGLGISGVTVTARSITKGLAQVLFVDCEPDGSFTLSGAGDGSYHVVATEDGKMLAQVGVADYRNEITLVASFGKESGVYSNIFIPSGNVVPLVEPEGFGGSATSDSVIAITEGREGKSTYSTTFGEADNLLVTGPPTGKGGLPIELAVGAKGVVVKSVAPGSLVSGAGLVAGDIVRAIDGIKVNSPTHARKLIFGTIGTVVVLEIVHDGEPLSIVVQRVRVP